MLIKRIVVGALFGLLTVWARVADASLADKLSAAISDKLTRQLAGGVTVPDFVTPIIQREAIRGIDFPVPPTSPGFAYTYDPELGVFERSTDSLGPVFSERADTVGGGRFALGFSYLYANLTDEGGDNFGAKVQVGYQGVAQGGVAVAGALFGRDFSLEQHVFAFTGTYGITDRLDLNLYLPLIYTRLKFKADTGIAVGSAFVLSPLSFDDTAFGVGDLLVRSKYRFTSPSDPLGVAAGLTLRLPTGNEDDFQGLGDFAVTPSLILSKAWGRQEIHANLGVEVNADDLQRTRVRYSLGGTLQPLDQLAFIVDFLGSSSFQDDSFTIPIRSPLTPVCNAQGISCPFVNSVAATRIEAFVPRTDILDLAVGFKVNIVETLVGFAAVIVPLSNDGIRADAVPTGGLEYTF